MLVKPMLPRKRRQQQLDQNCISGTIVINLSLLKHTKQYDHATFIQMFKITNQPFNFLCPCDTNN
jgi:hypothetical protein